MYAIVKDNDKKANVTRMGTVFNSDYQSELEQLVDGCTALAFPQIRHDFSDTMIYTRNAAEAS